MVHHLSMPVPVQGDGLFYLDDMANNDHLKIRLQERIRIYRNSPNCTATFADLQMFAEDMLEVIDANKQPMGFQFEDKK